MNTLHPERMYTPRGGVQGGIAPPSRSRGKRALEGKIAL